jgi:hypothetical protein
VLGCGALLGADRDHQCRPIGKHQSRYTSAGSRLKHRDDTDCSG